MMEAEINSILSTKQYKDLKSAVSCPNNFTGIHKSLHKKLMTYCDVLKKLLNDRELWENYEIPECIFHVLRLRYMIIGNVLKAIFTIHEKQKERFIQVFKKAYVKTFTFSQSGKKVKVVILSRFKNGQQGLDHLRPTLQNLSITPSRPRIVAPSSVDNAFEVLRNSASRISHRVQFLPEDVPIPVVDIPQIRPKPVDPNAIEVLPDESVASSRRTVPPATTSGRMDNEELDEEAMRVRQFLMECGIGIEGQEHIKTIADMDRFLETNITSLRTSTPQTIDVQPTRHASTESQNSDDPGVDLVVHAEVHPVPGKEDIPFSQILHILDSRNAALFKKPELITNQAQVQFEDHFTAQRRFFSVDSAPINIAAKRVGSQMHPIQISSVPMPVTEETAFASGAERSAEPGKSDLPVQQIDRENANDLMSVGDADGAMQFIQEILPRLPQTSPVQKPSQEKPVVERIERPSVRVQEAADLPVRPSIADLMLRATQQQIPTEVLRALDEPGPLIEIPQLDVPIDINQRTRPPSPLVQIGNILEPEDPAPARKNRVERKKYCFYSKLVLTRRMNKKYRTETYVSHAERLRRFLEFERDPEDRIFSFDEYEDDQPGGDAVRYIPRFRGSFGDQLPKCENMMANLLCQLFEKIEEDDLMYDEENECEMRIENLRESLRLLEESGPVLTGTPYRHEEELPVQISPSAYNQELSLLQVPFLEIPSKISLRSSAVPRQSLPSVDYTRPSLLAQEIPQIPAQTALNISNLADVSLLMPMAERLSLVQKTPVLPAAIQVPEVEVRSRDNIERDKLINWENVIPQKMLQKPIDQNIVDVVQTTNVPSITDTSLQIPVIESQNLAQETPVSIPVIQIAEVEVHTSENTERDKAIDWEEVIPQKRLRRTFGQNVVDVSQIPAESDQSARDLLMAQNAIHSSVAFAEFERQKELTVDGNIVGVNQIPTEIVLRPIDQTLFAPQNGIPASAAIEDPIENISPPRLRVTNEMVLEKLTLKWMEKLGKSIRFTDLCPLNETKRLFAASTFLALLHLHSMKMLQLDQESDESWSPESLIITPP